MLITKTKIVLMEKMQIEIENFTCVVKLVTFKGVRWDQTFLYKLRKRSSKKPRVRVAAPQGSLLNVFSKYGLFITTIHKNVPYLQSWRYTFLWSWLYVWIIFFWGGVIIAHLVCVNQCSRRTFFRQKDAIICKGRRVEHAVMRHI